MRAPRGLSAAEKALWERVAATVTPIERRPAADASAGHGALTKAVPDPKVAPQPPLPNPKSAPSRPLKGRVPPPLPPRPARTVAPVLDRHGLDSSWERKLKGARIDPDFTLDLHGHSLDAAHARLDHGLAQAKAMGARLVLVVTGKPRPVEHADRGERRGAIRAKMLDWLAAGPHGGDIAAVRGAHRRHGGDGALYIVLRRGR
jgi:DNA-nicking Smr family endonuclease